MPTAHATASDHGHSDGGHVHHGPLGHVHAPTPSVATYFTIYIALMVLMALTIIAAFLPLEKLPGHYWVRLIAMTIATIKGVLIILYFMHVKSGPRRAILFASAGFIWLAILFIFLMADYMTRNTPANYNPKGEPKFFQLPQDGANIATQTPPKEH